MKHTPILVKLAGLVGLVLLACPVHAQELPQGYFRNPLGSDIGLSATFAEFRGNHFHGGIDMRTGGEVNRPVYAAADGYVAKVSISPWGGGKILYIKHPNGYTSVYMHLNGYVGAIGKAVLREQYAQQSYAIVKMFGPDELPVKKGQMVAYSGNTGGSGGPHLHFEIRRGGEDDLHTHSTIYNPLHFDLPYTDNIKPIIQGVRIYPEGGIDYAVGANNMVTVHGPFHLGIYATDAAKGSTPRNGPDRVEVYLDGTLFFLYTTEKVPVDSTRMVNGLLDWPRYVASREPYLLTRALPGIEGPWVPVRMGDGVFRLAPGSTHSIGIRVLDIYGNVAERVVTVSVGEWQPKAHDENAASGEPVKYNQPFSFQQAIVKVQMPAYTLYADDRLAIDVGASTVKIEPTVNNIPPHLSYELSIRGGLAGVPQDKIVVVHDNGRRKNAQKTTHADGWHTAMVRDFGRFVLAADTVSPIVRPSNFSANKPVVVNSLKIKVADDLSGIESYHCYLNGEWILGEYDGKTATIVVDARGKLKAGSNKLRVVAVDGVGNTTDLTWNLTKQAQR